MSRSTAEGQLWSLVSRLGSESGELGESVGCVAGLSGLVSPTTRLRAWLRLALMQKKLGDYVSLIVDAREVSSSVGDWPGWERRVWALGPGPPRVLRGLGLPPLRRRRPARRLPHRPPRHRLQPLPQGGGPRQPGPTPIPHPPTLDPTGGNAGSPNRARPLHQAPLRLPE